MGRLEEIDCFFFEYPLKNLSVFQPCENLDASSALMFFIFSSLPPLQKANFAFWFYYFYQHS